MKRGVIDWLALMALAVGVAAEAGDLNPPPGPVAPTMKTLVEVEPRVNINALPGGGVYEHVITEPGSYYLTDNITLTLPISAIGIFASDVTIDLNGFTINGDDIGMNGIVHVAGLSDNIVVRNGIVRDFLVACIDLSNATNGRITDLHVYSSLGGISAGFGTVVAQCTARSCSEFGIRSQGGCRIMDCVAQNTGGAGGVGIDAGIGSVVTGCVASASTNGIRIRGRGHITHCVAQSCSGIGIWSSNGDARIESCHAISNTVGFQTDGSNDFIVTNTARSNGTDFSLSAGTRHGPIEDLTGAPGPIATTHPWANFRH